MNNMPHISLYSKYALIERPIETRVRPGDIIMYRYHASTADYYLVTRPAEYMNDAYRIDIILVQRPSRKIDRLLLENRDYFINWIVIASS
jgi:hypothetical protein